METSETEASIQALTDVTSKSTSYIGKRLPTDVSEKLAELRSKETNPLAEAVHQSAKDNQEAADKLDRPSCRDTGVIQYFIPAGARFPLLGELEEILRNATLEATKKGPLRHNAVETFDEKNTGTNTGSKIPWLDWELDPGSDSAIIDVSMAGGGCTLPGAANMLMPGEGCEGVAEFVFDVITARGVSACPPLLVGVGGSTSAESAARLSKEGDPSPRQLAALQLERREDGRAARRGSERDRTRPAGLTGNASVMGVPTSRSARVARPRARPVADRGMGRLDDLDPVARRAVAVSRDDETGERREPKILGGARHRRGGLPAPITSSRPFGGGGR